MNRTKATAKAYSYRAVYRRKKITQVVKWTLGIYLLSIPILYIFYRFNLFLPWWQILGGNPSIPSTVQDFALRTGQGPPFDLWRITLYLPQIVLGPLLAILPLFFIMIVQIGGLFWFLSRGRTYVLYPNEYDVSFDDVRGQPEIVESTKEALTLFQGFKKFREAGGYPPHGILFEGPPGTGKTLLGKAIAGEAGVPFMYASGSSFNNMFMGVGNMRIARLFRKARKFSEKYGGCVIFLDELDAVGGSRGAVSNARDAEERSLFDKMAHPLIMGGGFGGQGASMYVNELLIQMDGITMPTGIDRHIKRILRLGKPTVPQYNLMVIGATNQAATLDPALLRPGRFDRKLHVGLPTASGREDIFDYYLEKVPHADVDITRLARATYGFSPAKIKNMVNEALIFALSSGRDRLEFNDLWQAKISEEIGLKEPGTTSSRDQQITAFHEAGHAVMAYVLLRDEQVQMASISKRGSTLGVVYHTPIEEQHSRLREDMRRSIMVSLGGMVAEEIYFGEAGTGHSSDLQNATYTAARMLGMLGMGEDLISYSVIGQGGMTSPVVEILRDPDNRKAMGKLLAECKAETHEAVRRNDAAMRTLAERLLEKREVPGEEIEDLMVAKGVVRADPTFRPQLELTGNGWHPPAFVPYADRGPVTGAGAPPVADANGPPAGPPTDVSGPSAEVNGAPLAADGRAEASDGTPTASANGAPSATSGASADGITGTPGTTGGVTSGAATGATTGATSGEPEATPEGTDAGPNKDEPAG